MSDVPFRFHISGGYADESQLQAYDGFMALAGFALSLSLVANYVETGKIRRRGDFPGRHLVRALPLEQGSVVSDFIVQIKSLGNFGQEVAQAITDQNAFLQDVFKRTIDRNLGAESSPTTQGLRELERRRGGDLDALVAATEPSFRQAHMVIGEGANLVNIYGGSERLAIFNPDTKAYVDGSYMDQTVREKDVSVASFNANSGYGSVFDADLGRTIPIQLTKNTLAQAKTVLSWGLDQYANATGRLISLRYYTVRTFDERPKKYIVLDAQIPAE